MNERQRRRAIYAFTFWTGNVGVVLFFIAAVLHDTILFMIVLGIWMTMVMIFLPWLYIQMTKEELWISHSMLMGPHQ